MDSLEQAILKTVLYLDLCDFAPTLLDIEKWLLQGSPSATLGEINAAIEDSKRLTITDGVVTLVGRQELVHMRRTKYDYTETKWKRVRPFLRLLSWLPGVEAIWLCNAMGWGNAKKESDIDLCIVASAGNIWSARFFTTALMKLLRQRPEEIDQSKAICLSFYIDEHALDLSPYQLSDHDIPFAFWVAQMYPVFGPESLYTQYQHANSHWLKKIFHQLRFTIPNPKHTITHTWIERGIKKIVGVITPERILRAWQKKHIPKKIETLANTDTRVILSDTILKLHTNDNRAQRQKQWEHMVNQYR